MHLPFVSVVIVTYNSEDYIERCIDSLFRLDYPQFEVIIVDGGSTDKTIQKVKSKAIINPGKINLICNENSGVSADRNRGINASKGKYIFLLDADTSVEHNSLKELVELIEAKPMIGIAQPKIVLMDHEKICNAGTQMDRFGWTLSTASGENRLECNSSRELICGDTTAMLVRKSAVNKVGLFDEFFYYYYEATDLSYRIVLNGSKIVYWPKSVVYHKVGHARKRKPLTWRLFSFNLYHLAFIIKNYNINEIVQFGFPVFLVTFLSSLYFLAKKRINVALSILKSLITVTKNFNTIWSKHLLVKHWIRNTAESKKTRVNIDGLFAKPLWKDVFRELKLLSLEE
jgi:GT2 family glycosyltransferase